MSLCRTLPCIIFYFLDISATEVTTTAGNADTLPPVAKTTSVPGQGISTTISFYFGISFLS